MAIELSLTIPRWDHYHRLVPSRFPPINIFEKLVDPDELEAVYAVESLTNDRLRDEAGDIRLVAPDDRVAGPGSAAVMAPFTHIGKASRFTDGSYGVLYAASCTEAAIAETRFHRARFLAATNTPPIEITMREYVGPPAEPLLDIRDPACDDLHDPDPSSYVVSQRFGADRRAEGTWGILYRSVRYLGAECLAAFKPAAVGIPVQASHYRYIWDGKEITHVLQVSEVRID